MTATGSPSDGALATAVAAGDVSALAAVYDRYAPRLLGFCRSMLRDPAAAEDCLQDVFVIAATRLGSLREPDLLRSWLFSVARHECLGRIDKRKREVLVDEVADRPSHDPDPSASAALDAELAQLLRDAGAGLSDRDRLLLELADRQQLAGEEFAAAVGVPRATAYTLLARARATAKKSIGALLVARTGRDRCAELDALLSGWDGTLTALRRKQLARHIEKCATCDDQRSRVASGAALLGGEGEAFAARLVSLRTRILDAAAAAMRAEAALTPWAGGWPPADPVLGADDRRRRRGLLAALLVLALTLLTGGIVLAGAPLRTRLAEHPGIVAPPAPSAPATVPAPPASAPRTEPTGTTSAPASPTRRHPHPPRTTVPAPPSPTTPSSSTRPTPTPTGSSRPRPTPTPSTTTASATTSPPPRFWTLTVAPQSISVAWGSDKATCAGSVTAVPLPCTYQVPDGATVAVTVGPSWRFDSPSQCIQSTTGTCSFVMDADQAVTVHIS